MEIWKDIEDYEEYYQISNLGRIRNKKESRILKPSKSGGYYHISLRYGNKKEMLIHRLVAKAFIPNPLNLSYVNHKDENKLNNNVENLEWCTAKYNNSYGKGALARNQRVIQYDLQGNAIKIWESIKEASEELGVSQEYQLVAGEYTRLPVATLGLMRTYQMLECVGRKMIDESITNIKY